MKYLSTRASASDPGARKRFCEILLEGLAPDGGLYLPESYPQVDTATLARWRKVYHEQGYGELAFEVLSLYIDDIAAPDLRALCRKTYTEDVFGSSAIVPLKKLQLTAAGTEPVPLYLEALSNGPTLAFKDMAMQLLGNLFEYELARRGEQQVAVDEQVRRNLEVRDHHARVAGAVKSGNAEDPGHTTPSDG